MRRIRPIQIPAFVEAIPETSDCYLAWSATFLVGEHVYALRFEAMQVDDDNYRAFCVEQQIPTGQDRTLHFIKFDNVLNEVGIGTEYQRLPPGTRLTISELWGLAECLAGGIQQFVNAYEPNMIVGLPNDAKLEMWYRRLIRRSYINGRLVEMRESSYHPRNILLIHRV